MNSIPKEYPYRLQFWTAILIGLILIPAGGGIVWEQFQNPCSPDMTSGDCSFGSPTQDLLGRGFLILIGLVNIFIATKALWESYLSVKSPLRKRISLTGDSIIGPAPGFWSSKEHQIHLNEVIEFDLIRNQQGVVILIKSRDTRILIDRRYMSKEDFSDVYNTLAKRFQRPLFDQVMIDAKLELASAFYLLSFIPYMFLTIALASLFMENMNKQVDATVVFPVGIILNILCLFLFLFLIKRFKKPHKQGLIIVLCIFMGAASFFVGLVGFPSIVSFFNQLRDDSIPEKKITTLIQDQGQSKESKKEDGICYEFKHFDEETGGFGGGNLCQRDHSSISERTQAEVYIKKGNFNDRWVYKYKLLNGTN